MAEGIEDVELELDAVAEAEAEAEGAGLGDGGVLRCMCLQVRVLENHQNGKDTHIRGIQLFARDERAGRLLVGGVGKGAVPDDDAALDAQLGDLEPLDASWLGEAEIR